ncbi:MAG: hypothetical protein JST84_07250 [Acidobacteria bacterium]|nr:hypothetical protein [Acidobacteriota bacterium]
MVSWQAILLIYPQINVRLSGSWWRRRTFQHQLSPAEIQDALNSFQYFPALAQECSQGQINLITTVTPIERPLSTLTAMGEGMYWPSPNDTRQELDKLVMTGTFDSVFVLWPQNNLLTGEFVPTGGWGLGMGASDWSNGATYATVANAATATWERPVVGEVWLHEWLHGVCHHFAQQGFVMPDGDADGGGRHGYVQSETTGWTEYYRDLMSGKVNSGEEETGIPVEAWQSGSIHSSAS